MRGKTERINTILQKVLANKGITKSIQLNSLRKIVNRFFTDTEKKHLKVGNVKNDKLVLHLDSSSLLYEIKCFRKDNLLDFIKQESDQVIKDIILVLDKH